jgi:transposase
MMLVDGSALGGSDGRASGGPRRRRRWTRAQKRRLVAETLAPGASVSLVARRYDVNANLLFTWRRQMRRGTLGEEPPGAADDESLPLIPIEVTADGKAQPPQRPPARDDRAGIIEIALPSGERLRVDAGVDEPALRRVLTAIRSLS